jgi:hypothetical protein
VDEAAENLPRFVHGHDFNSGRRRLTSGSRLRLATYIAARGDNIPSASKICRAIRDYIRGATIDIETIDDGIS